MAVTDAIGLEDAPRTAMIDNAIPPLVDVGAFAGIVNDAPKPDVYVRVNVRRQ